QADPPRQLAQCAGRALTNQVARRLDLGALVRHRRGPRLEPEAIALEFHQPEIGFPLGAVVAPTILENEETRAVALVLDASAARDDHRDPVVLSLRHEHVAYLGLRIVELFDEEDPVGRDRFAEPAGR